ncbi:MAG TPA: hypothetical protein VEZ70_12545 [Allosphingosinicella sp.]|jgi:hypothetical protein|nr:hypothetical protein [Allosphingosinicella sp.]
MALPRPSSPKALLADLRALASERSTHHWVAGGLAVLMPAAVIVLFYTDVQTNIAPKPQVIFAESWSADRSDEQIKAEQVTRQAEKEARQKERQRQFKALDDRLEKMGI